MAIRVCLSRFVGRSWTQVRRGYSNAEGMPLTFSSPTKASTVSCNVCLTKSSAIDPVHCNFL